MEIIKVGVNAPDFNIKDHNDSMVRLSDLRGNKILLSFHPLAWTNICAKQMQSLESNKDKFNKLNTTALGINVDSVPSKKAWAMELGIKNTRLLSDFWPHGEVADKYGIFIKEKGFSGRANIILDENGIVIFVKKYPISTLPDIKEIIDFLEK